MEPPEEPPPDEPPEEPPADGSPPPLAPPELDELEPEEPPPDEDEDEPEEPDDPEDPDEPEELGIDELLEELDEDCCPPAQPPISDMDTAPTTAMCTATLNMRFSGSRVRIADTPVQKRDGADASSRTLRRRR